MSVENTAKSLLGALTPKQQPTAYDTPATVSRVEGDTLWVHVPGGMEETPVKRTIDASEGDEIQIRVGGGRAWAVGNASAPPTDDTTANHAVAMSSDALLVSEAARNAASVAQASAASALASAERASEAADIADEKAVEAQNSATSASQAANSALNQLSTVEDVVGTLNWISEHGTYKATTDTEVVHGKLYFTRTGSGTEQDPYEYSVVTNPTGNPSTAGYFELDSVDEAVSNYVASHLALTDEGLYVINDQNGWRVLIKNDGVYIVDTSGVIVAQYKNVVTIGEENKTHVNLDFHSLQLVDKEGNTYFYVSDLRDSSGVAELESSFIGDGSTTKFNTDAPIDSVLSVTVNGVKKTEQSDYEVYTFYILFLTAPASGDSINVVYRTRSYTVKAYTFGMRGVGKVGRMSTAFGLSTVASGSTSLAEGYETTASGMYSHAEGRATTASGLNSHAEGNNTTASDLNSHAEGRDTTASGLNSHAEGNTTKAIGNSSHAEGYVTEVSGNYSHAEGYKTLASGLYSHAEGGNTIASDVGSHAEGFNTVARGNSSHAEGYITKATGNYSHAEGDSTIASGNDSHAEGYTTQASGVYSHAEGYKTIASGNSSHAEGYITEASGEYSHAEGYKTVANHVCQTVSGQYNIADPSTNPSNGMGTYIEIIGNGNSVQRSNARTLDWDGNEVLAGNLTVNNNIRLYADGEGGNIRFLSKSGYVTEMDSYNDTQVRIISRNAADTAWYTLQWNREDNINLSTIKTQASNAVKKTGGTTDGMMTGRLYIKSSNITDKYQPSENTYGQAIEFVDSTSSNARLGYIQPVAYSDGGQGLLIGGYRDGIGNSLGLFRDKNGNQYVTLGQAAWQRALGITTTSGTYTPSIKWSSSGSPTVSSGVYQWIRSGNVIMIHGRFNITALNAPSTAGQLTISLPSGISVVNSVAAVGQLMTGYSHTVDFVGRVSSASGPIEFGSQAGSGISGVMQTGWHNFHVTVFVT